MEEVKVGSPMVTTKQCIILLGVIFETKLQNNEHIAIAIKRKLSTPCNQNHKNFCILNQIKIFML